MATVPLLRGSTGIDTVNDPTRIKYSPESGVSDLAVAVNVTLSPSGRVNRRTGKTLRIPLDSHSLFCDGGECVFVYNKGLYLLETDFSYRLLCTLSTNDLIAYTQIENRIYYTNNQDLGYIEDGIRYAWEKTTDYVGPTTQRTFTGPFVGNHLAYHGGRAYIAKGPVLWWSEYGALTWFDMARSFAQYGTNIRMVKHVEDGLYVSTEKEIYFLAGLVPHEFEQKKVRTYPALEWSDAIDYVDGSDIPGFEVNEPCALWSTTKGAMLGCPGRIVINLNKKKVVYPKGTRGRSLLRGLNFIHTVE